MTGRLRFLRDGRANRRILYLEGEPRWEFKFLRRAVENDRNIDLVTILRTTQNKNYVQDPAGTAPKSVKDGLFPTNGEDLFDFDGLIIGSVDAPYLTPNQQTIMIQGAHFLQEEAPDEVGKALARFAASVRAGAMN